MNDLTSKTEDTSNQIAQLETNINNLREVHQSELAKSASDIENLQQKLIVFGEEKDKLISENSELSGATKVLNVEINSLRQSILNTTTAESEKSGQIQNKLIEENSTFRNEIQTLKTELQTLNTDLVKKATELKSVAGNREETQKMLTEKLNRIVLLESELETLRMQVKTGNDSNNQMSKMQERLNVAELKHTASSSELAKMKDDYSTLVNEMQKLTGTNKIRQVVNFK
jgi:chromosome segregation ATPase